MMCVQCGGTFTIADRRYGQRIREEEGERIVYRCHQCYEKMKEIKKKGLRTYS